MISDDFYSDDIVANEFFVSFLKQSHKELERKILQQDKSSTLERNPSKNISLFKVFKKIKYYFPDNLEKFRQF